MSLAVETVALRERILDEATALFARAGYHGVAMRQIATAAAVSKPGLYYHFADKERLFLAILLRGIERIGDLVDGALATGGSTRERVGRLVLALATQARGSQRLMRLAEHDADGLEPASRAQMHAAYRARFIAPIQALVRAGVSTGELRDVDVERVTWLLLSLVQTALSSPPERVPEAVDLIVSVFFDGVARIPADDVAGAAGR
jgi:AcrR family transcriptional regulator